MATQEADFDGDLWFFTRKSSPKTAEIQGEHNVNLSYANPSDNVYVSVSGTAQLVDDRAKAEELWSPFYKAWFPDGLDDPELALLKIHVEQAEYWDAPGSGVVHLIGFAKAALTGKTYQPGEHEKIEFVAETS
jgi:general stress protein 26